MAFIENLTLFVLAGFLGYELVTKIPATLHTPLISGTNAISGITLIGSVVVAGSGNSTLASVLGFFAVVLATINVVGGYLVSHKMLRSFGRRGGE
ncbi:NAD(P) transhydrogenase subunit alpha [Halobellus litoreus]|uniref:proton-translocating NAD(P)(+) transhydrogenase n=1 Tax=Halobellus litoreus TaxID=755310 RepID=A0ABD6DUJ1_9EURY|nr:NAD(P) transhydrogenase subunit alpha [Halobellus litoreus]